MKTKTVYCITTGEMLPSCRAAAKHAGASETAFFNAWRRAKDRGCSTFFVCGREYSSPEKVKVDPLAVRSRWIPYPLHIPEDGLYAVAIEIPRLDRLDVGDLAVRAIHHVEIVYDVFKWHDGEWEIPLAGGKVVAFQKLEPYEG